MPWPMGKRAKDTMNTMNTTGAAIASAVVFVWLGMVLAISFLEAR